MLKLGTFFYEILVKDNKAQATLKDARKGLNDLRSTSLEAKAAIAGSVYALYKFMSNSAQMGADFVEFSHLTDLSTESLQKWQYALMEGGGTAEDMMSTVKGIQSTFAKMRLTGAYPEFLNLLASRVGFDISRSDDPFYVMQKGQEYAQRKDIPAGERNEVLRSLGFSDAFISAGARGFLNPENMRKNVGYTQAQIRANERLNVAWKKFFYSAEVEIGKLNAQFGGQLVSDLQKVSTEFFGVVKVLAQIAKEAQVFKGISLLFEGIRVILNGWKMLIEEIRAALPEKIIERSAEGLATLVNDPVGTARNDWKKIMDGIASYAPSAGELLSPHEYMTRLFRATDIRPSTGVVNINTYVQGVSAEEVVTLIEGRTAKTMKRAMGSRPVEAGGR